MMKRKMGEGGWNGNNKHNAMLTVAGEGAGTIRGFRLRELRGVKCWRMKCVFGVFFLVLTSRKR